MATVVLVHGLFGAFGDQRTWERLSPHQVVVPDLLGYGEHAGTRQRITIEAQVEHLHALLGDQPLYLIGHSVGGVIASMYAHRHPEGVLALINVEGNFTLADAFWSQEMGRKTTPEASALLPQTSNCPASGTR
jgi:lipase